MCRWIIPEKRSLLKSFPKESQNKRESTSNSFHLVEAGMSELCTLNICSKEISEKTRLSYLSGELQSSIESRQEIKSIDRELWIRTYQKVDKSEVSTSIFSTESSIREWKTMRFITFAKSGFSCRCRGALATLVYAYGWDGKRVKKNKINEKDPQPWQATVWLGFVLPHHQLSVLNHSIKAELRR